MEFFLGGPDSIKWDFRTHEHSQQIPKKVIYIKTTYILTMRLLMKKPFYTFVKTVSTIIQTNSKATLHNYVNLLNQYIFIYNIRYDWYHSFTGISYRM